MRRLMLAALLLALPFAVFAQWTVAISHPPDTLDRILGVDAGASEGFDSLDYIFPAFPMEFIYYFVIDDSISTLWRDIRPPADTIVWTLVGQWRMYTDVSPETVYWNPSTLPLGEGQFYFDTLADMSTKQNMLDVDHYVFMPASSYGTSDTLYIQFIAGAAPPEDTIPPYADNWYPPCGSDNVPVDLDSFSVDILDAISGVDSASIRITFYGTDVTAFAMITPIPGGYHIKYNIPVTLPYDSDIAVDINASDLAGNSTEFSCAWHTEPAATGYTISGYVYDANTGDPLSGVAITDDSLLYSALSDSTGYYEITGVAPGTHIFAAYKDGYTTEIDTIVVTDSDVEHDFFLSPALTTVTITGTVYDASTGDPIEGATVDAMWASGSASDTTGADGSYTLTDIPGGELVLLTAAAPGYMPDTAGGAFGTDTTIDFYLTPLTTGHTIAGYITLEGESDYSGTEVFLVGYGSTITDADGYFEFTGLTPGDYEIGAYHEGFGSFDTVVNVADADVMIEHELPALPPEFGAPTNVVASDTESGDFYAHLIHITWDMPGEYTVLAYDDGDLTNAYVIPLLTSNISETGVLYSTSAPVVLKKIEIGYYGDHPGRCAVREWDGSAPALDLDVAYSTYITSDGMMVFDFGADDVTLDGDFFVDFSVPVPVDTLYPIADSVATDEHDANTFIYAPAYSAWLNVVDADSSFSGFVWLVRVYVSDESGRVMLLEPDGSLTPVDDEFQSDLEPVPASMPLARAAETMDITEFRIYRSTSPFTSTTDPGVELIDSVDAGMFEYWDTDVEPGTEYYYGVTAVYDDTLESPLSNVDMGMAIDFRPSADILILDWDEGENLADGGTADEVEFIRSMINTYVAGADTMSIYVSDQDELLQHFDLTNYRWVFIVAGNSSPMPPIRFYSDTANISAFLASGEGLFIEGANFAKFMDTYFGDYLVNFGVSFVDDGSPDSNVRTLTAVAPDFFGASDEFTVDYSFGTIADRSVDEIAPAGGTALFVSQESDPAPVGDGTRVVYRSGECPVLFSTIYFGSIVDDTEPPATRDAIMSSLLEHLGFPISDIAEKPAKPARAVLVANTPNPFNASTEIRFELPASGRVKLEVVDAAGRVVSTLVDGTMTAGTHRVVWNGTDARGREVPSGIYTCRLTVDGRTVSHRMTLVK